MAAYCGVRDAQIMTGGLEAWDVVAPGTPGFDDYRWLEVIQHHAPEWPFRVREFIDNAQELGREALQEILLFEALGDQHQNLL